MVAVNRGILRGRASKVTTILAVLLVVAGTLAAVLSRTGEAQAAAARHGPHAGIALAGGVTSRSPHSSAPKQCFYTGPDCASTNPAVAFGISSNGDTSACTFQYTTAWGDGTSETKTFPGGPDGTILYEFQHTYASTPAVYTLTVTGQTTVGSCTAGGGTLQFTLTGAGLQAARFAAISASALTTPGLPVIKDDVEPFQDDRSWLPSGLTSCNGLASPKDFDYLDCGSPLPSGTPAKDWPVIYTAGGALTISKVVFAANSDITDPKVSATATVTGSGTSASLTLAGTGISEAEIATGVYELTAYDLTFAGTLPAVPGRDQLSIAWTITGSGGTGTLAAGTSQHPLYVTAAPYVAPTGDGADQVMKPYESLVDVGTVAAAGKSGQQAAFKAILATFASRKIRHPSLNPATGVVTSGPSFMYYKNGWPTIGDWWNNSIGSCPDFQGMLQDNTGHCGNWAEFLAGVLAFQGISAATVQGLTDVTGFYPGPSPGDGGSAADDAYMLVGPALWSFGTKNRAGNYPYQDSVTVTHGRVTVAGTHVAYKPSSSKLVGQGPVYDPPPMFATGDHAIVSVTLSGSTSPVYVDPSYGNPQPSAAPYPTIKAYEPTAIAGFAVVYQKEADGKLTPLPVENIASTCATSTCVFDAVPYAQSGAATRLR
jgi:hypothetical protein